MAFASGIGADRETRGRPPGPAVCMRAGQTPTAWLVLEEMLTEAVPPDTTTFNVLIAGCAARASVWWSHTSCVDTHVCGQMRMNTATQSREKSATTTPPRSLSVTNFSLFLSGSRTLSLVAI